MFVSVVLFLWRCNWSFSGVCAGCCVIGVVCSNVAALSASPQRGMRQSLPGHAAHSRIAFSFHSLYSFSNFHSSNSPRQLKS